jgi:GDPmannose 4,6-dehydratase
MTVRWRGKGADEKGYDAKGRVIVAIDPRYYRPAEVETLLGDAAKARRQLKWQPRIDFRALVAEMAREDLKVAQRDALISRHGYRAYGGRE